MTGERTCQAGATLQSFLVLKCLIANRNTGGTTGAMAPDALGLGLGEQIEVKIHKLHITCFITNNYKC